MEKNLWSQKEDPCLNVSEIEIMYSPPVKPSQRICINGSADAEKLLRKIWAIPLDLRECFYALFLNRANKVLGYFLVSIGGLSGTVADVRTIFQAALKANACSIILAHNHPSGNGTPSLADIQLTERMKGAGLIMEIPLLDHIILLSEGYYSMADQGYYETKGGNGRLQGLPILYAHAS
jgi:DNA repair protein RadC